MVPTSITREAITFQAARYLISDVINSKMIDKLSIYLVQHSDVI